MGPLAAIAIPAAIQVGSSLISKYLNEPSRAEKESLQATLDALRLSNEMGGLRLDQVKGIQKEIENFRKKILIQAGKGKGKPLVMKSPDGSEKSQKEWERNLRQMMGAVDFGGKRWYDASMDLLPQMTMGAGGAAGAGLAQGLQSQRRQDIGGTANMLSDLGMDLFNARRSGGAPTGGLATLLGVLKEGGASGGIAPIPDAGFDLGPDMLPSTLPLSIPQLTQTMPIKPLLEGGF